MFIYLGNVLKDLLFKIKNFKLISFLVSLILSISISYMLISSELLSVSGWLSWTLGIGVLGVLLLHAKSFFSSDVSDLGFYYSRLYGLFFSFSYTSLIFLVLMKIGDIKVTATSLFVLLIVVFCIGIYNFLRNNYEDLALNHLLAKNLMTNKSEDKE